MNGNTTPKDQTNARHHYLPQMYLKGFTEKGKLAVWQRADGKLRSSTPDQAANIKAFYTFTNKDGKKTDELEAALAELEGKTKSVIDNLHSLFPPQIIGQTKETMAYYLAFQHLRTPVKRKEMEQTYDMHAKLSMWPNIQSDEQIAKSLQEAGMEPTDEAIKQIREFRDNPHALEAVPSKEALLMLQLKSVPTLVGALMARNWHVVKFDKPSLITSDNPILLKPDENAPYHWLRGVGFGNAKEIWFPLSSTMLLVLTYPDYKGLRFLQGGSMMAARANNMQLASSYMEAFGLPSVMQQFEGSGLGARALTQIDAGFEKEFFDHYNKPPAKPRPSIR